MSFDIYLIPLHVAGRAFDAAALETILDGHSPETEADVTQIVTADGGADVYGAPSPERWLLVNRAAGEAVWRLIFELAVAGPMAIQPVGSATFVTAFAHAAAVPQELAGPLLVVADHAELRAAIVDAAAVLPSVPISQSRAALAAFLAARGAGVETLGVSDVGHAVSSWYGMQRVRDVDLESDGDMLLFQWGVYDWGDGPSFQYNVTRQLAVGESGDSDPQIWQLSLTLHFPATAEMEALARGHQWCDHPDRLAEFQRFVAAAAPTTVLASRSRQRVEWSLEQVD